jgi:dTDP-4-amino-4,6-dideoxygalactose transaminase
VVDSTVNSQALHAAGIATRREVMASHLEPPYRAMDARLPATEAATADCLQLPIHAGMGEAETKRMLAVLEQTYRRG